MDRDKIKTTLEAALTEEQLDECRRRAIRQEELYVPKTPQERVMDNYLVLLGEYQTRR